MKLEKKRKKSQQKQKDVELRKHLASVRVVQKNLVYVIGLPAKLADEDNLKRSEFFGQYGKIFKIVINRSNQYNSGPSPTVSAYITFGKAEEAAECIQAIGG